MKKWEEFEEQCLEFLEENFGDYADFILQGKENSIVSDILVLTEGGEDFYIEVKHVPAQCGQFVLFPNPETKKFEFSNRNKININEPASTIIDHMNKNFEIFSNAGTKGVPIVFQNCGQVFRDWIVEAYKAKNVHLVISNGFSLISLDKILPYFDISACYRVKKSGSNSPSKKDEQELRAYISKQNIFDLELEKNQGRLYARTAQNIDDERLTIEDRTFSFVKSDNPQLYEVRRLSNTNNANVIFSIDTHDTSCELSHETVEKFLRQNKKP